MGQGNSKNQKIDWINSFDPRLTGLASPKGTLFRFIPPGGTLAQLLMKQDDGFSTAWRALAQDPNTPNVYYVSPGGQYPTIQSAIDAAYAAGSGSPGEPAFTIRIAPGRYEENLTFRPGQALIGDSTDIAIGAITVVGQHVYNPPAGGDILEKLVLIQGLSFFDPMNGNTITVEGVNEGFFSVQGCSFVKGGVSGSSLYCSLTGCIFVVVGTSWTAAYTSPDPIIYCASVVCVLQQISHTSGSPAPLIDYNGPGSCQMINCSVQCMAPYVARIQQGQGTTYQNFLASFATGAVCFQVEAGAVLYCTFSTLIVDQFVFAGTGVVNATMLVYGITTNIDPGLTFTQLPSLPA